MLIISWNVNSIRTRIERVVELLKRHQPDVLCLQETKVIDDDFPYESIEEAGYQSAVFGQKTYNGVALLSKVPLQDVQRGFEHNPIAEQSRVISGVLNGVRIYNLYVVNGKSIDNDAYQIKLAWLDAFARHLSARHQASDPLLLVGDFNIAPSDGDVYDPAAWHEQNLCSSPERARLAALRGWGVSDLHHHINPEPGQFTWWDYRDLAFPKNMGLRIDLAFGTAPIVSRCTNVTVDRNERKATSGPGKPSDHAPLLVHLSD